MRTFGAAGHPGVRQDYEDDAAGAADRFAVADGAGAMQDGRWTAELAVGVVHAAGPLVPAVEAVNREVWRRAHDPARPDRTGGTTTLSALAFDGDRVELAHVGNSRIYLLRGGRLTRLTVDHVLPRHPAILLRTLGIAAEVTVDRTLLRHEPGDRWLLCTDGLFEPLDDATLARLLGDAPDPQSAADALIAAAVAAGVQDNLTALCVFA
jgi:protein phosphatase